jgi:chemotaxis protein methyltransferase CheR
MMPDLTCVENRMDRKTFDRFRSIVYEKSGIAINENKIALVMARVGKRMRELSLSNARDYLELVLADERGEEIVHLLDSIATNVTSFFRERDHFDLLARLLRERHASGQTRFRLWSAAASSGEEPYSMAMVALDVLDEKKTDIKILATDISTRILERCKKGEYEEKHVAAVPPQYRTRFFSSAKTGERVHYEIKEQIRRMISFSRINLSETPFPMKGPFDVIFLRNVMIYFDNTVRKRLLEECFRLLGADGHLFVGHAETLTGLISEFKPVAPSVYVKK